MLVGKQFDLAVLLQRRIRKLVFKERIKKWNERVEDIVKNKKHNMRDWFRLTRRIVKPGN